MLSQERPLSRPQTKAGGDRKLLLASTAEGLVTAVDGRIKCEVWCRSHH